jgi:tetratricopeptide (TPR) repeat protein
VERALEIDPSYAEALYVKGVILLNGLGRPEEAAAAFRAYLREAPFGSHREEVERLLERSKGSP